MFLRPSQSRRCDRRNIRCSSSSCIRRFMYRREPRHRTGALSSCRNCGDIEGFGRPDDACMVARAGLPNGPQIVGAAWARIFPNNSAGYGTIDTATPEVSISLLPDWRNRGIGHRLMTALLDRLRTDGHAAASLSVQRTNANALHLYESLGFTIISEHDGELVMRVALAD